MAGVGNRLSDLTEAELLTRMAELVDELRRRHVGNDTVHWTDLERNIAREAKRSTRR